MYSWRWAPTPFDRGCRFALGCCCPASFTAACGAEQSPWPAADTPFLWLRLLLQVMLQPVLTPCGRTFEYEALRHWINQHGRGEGGRSLLLQHACVSLCAWGQPPLTVDSADTIDNDCQRLCGKTRVPFLQQLWLQACSCSASLHGRQSQHAAGMVSAATRQAAIPADATTSQSRQHVSRWPARFPCGTCMCLMCCVPCRPPQQPAAGAHPAVPQPAGARHGGALAQHRQCHGRARPRGQQLTT